MMGRDLALVLLSAFVCVNATTTAHYDEAAAAFGVVRINSNPDIPPTVKGPVKVSLALQPIKFRDVDKARGEVEMVTWLTEIWKDPRLAWWAGGASNVSGISVDVKHLWTPDIIPYNLVTAPETLSPRLASVSSDGAVIDVPALRIRFHCDLEGLDRTEGANCTIKFGSWTHNGYVLDLAQPSPPDLSSYVADSNVELLAVYAQRDVAFYPCCPEPYVNVKFTLNLRSRGAGSFFDW